MSLQGTMQNTGFYDHKSMKDKLGVSSLKIMDGEDLTYGDRKYIQSLQQKEWIEQQTREKEAKLEAEKQAKKLFEEQTLKINEMRTKLEEDHNMKRKMMEKATKDVNLQLMYEKYDKDRMEKESQENEKKKHLQFSSTNDFIAENPLTCQSHYQNHRVLKYHWKGMNLQEKKDILNTVDQQLKEKDKIQSDGKIEEKAYALQTEHNRLMLINLERDKTKKLNHVKNNVKEYNLLLAKEQKYRNKHAYD